MTEVEVAVLGNAESPFGADFFPYLDLPYRELPIVKLKVPDDQKLGPLLAEAASTAGLQLESRSDGGVTGYVGFHAFDIEDPLGQISHHVPLVDEEGRVYWSADFNDATVAQLRRAYELHVLPGDYRRPYLVLAGGHGDAPGIVFDALILLFGAVSTAVALLSNLEGTLAFSERVRSALSDKAQLASEYVERESPSLEGRGAQVGDLRQLLTRHDWPTPELAERLGARSAAEAEAVRALLQDTDPADPLGELDVSAEPTLAAAVQLLWRLYWRSTSSGTGSDLDSESFARNLAEVLATGRLGSHDETQSPTPLVQAANCACGEPACSTRADLYVMAGQGVVVSMGSPSTHFVIDQRLLAAVSAEAIHPGSFTLTES